MLILQPSDMGILYRILLCLNGIFSDPDQISRIIAINFEPNGILDFPTEILDIKKSTYTSFGPERIDSYVVNMAEINLLDMINVLMSHYRFYPDALFIFIGEDMDHDYLETLFTYYILNIYFFNTTNGDISTFYPYAERIHPPRDLILQKIGDIKNCSKDIFFQKKFPPNWLKSKLQICLSPAAPSGINENEGIYPDIFNFIANRLNLDLNWTIDVLPKTGFWLEHYMRMFYEGKCEIHSGYIMTEAEPLTAFTFSSAYWFVPSPSEVKTWSYAFRVFGRRAWIGWVVFIILLCVMWSIQHVVLKENQFFLHFLAAFILISSLLLEQIQKFNRYFITSNILIFLMFLQSFMMNMLFKSKFPVFLIGIHYESPDINNIEDVMEKGMLAGVPDYFLPILNSKPEIGKYLQYHLELCYVDNVCLKRTAFEKDIATVQVKMFFMYERKSLLDENGRDLVRLLEPPVISGTMNPIMPKGHPFIDELNRYLMYCWDHGFVVKIINNYTHDDDFDDMDFGHIRLEIRHIILALGLLVSGLSLGLTIFSFEFTRS